MRKLTNVGAEQAAVEIKEAFEKVADQMDNNLSDGMQETLEDLEKLIARIEWEAHNDNYEVKEILL